MNSEATDTQERGVLPLLMSMIGTRLELAAIDTEAHVQATLSAMLAMCIAVVVALMALVFVGVAVIVAFWETHRLAAALGVLGAYSGSAVAIALFARATWKSRPSAFAATLRELELDREAFRSQT
jgi:uncharacterized membrane protein YqjE